MKNQFFLTLTALLVGLAPCAPAEPPCGDCNEDGVVSVLDALVAARHAAGLVVLAGPALRLCDVQPSGGDGAVTALDALLVAQAAAGLTGSLVCVPFIPDGWTGMIYPGNRAHAGLAYDSRRDVLVVHGGRGGSSAVEELGDTYEWDGQSWSRRLSLNSPGPRAGPGMAYDERRGVTVLFGGGTETGILRDTWEWDGTEWIEKRPATSPPNCRNMVYDSNRERVVCFVWPSLWEYDGVDWTEIVATLPIVEVPNADIAVAYDSWRSRLVLLYTSPAHSGGIAETWEWDGAAWQQAQSPTRPTGSVDPVMTFDSRRGVCVLLAGAHPFFASDAVGETWEWDGVLWTERLPAQSAGWWLDARSVYDPNGGATIVFGGYDVDDQTPDSRRPRLWDGVDWRQAPLEPQPPVNADHAMTFDAGRGETVLYGGVNIDPFQVDSWFPAGETWVWDGARWRRRSPPVSPPPLRSATMAYDTDRGVAVLFGGMLVPTTSDSDQTWEWDGTTWLQRFPPVAPSPRHNPSMVYHAASHVVLLHGGMRADGLTLWGSPLGGTWEWDGASWTERLTATTPDPRGRAAMAYDAARERTVMVGGWTIMAPTQPLNSTWEWDGSDWSLVGELSMLPGGFGYVWDHHLVSYDPRLGCVLFVPTDYPYMPYLWDGATWFPHKVAQSRVDTPGLHGQMVYDSRRGVNVFYGLDWFPGLVYPGTWEY